MFKLSADAGERDKEYEVERIIGYRYNIIKKCNEYLVHWKGYDSSNDSWEEYRNLKLCASKLREFYERIRNKCSESVGRSKIEGSESDDSDLVMTSDDDTYERRVERVFPSKEKSGMACGWKPRKILGWQNRKKPHTYLIEYKYKRQVEHLPVKYVAKKYPKELFFKFYLYFLCCS